MSNQFKPGDLAIITHHTFAPAIGRCVELVSRHLVGPVDRSNPEQPVCYDQEGEDAAWIVTGDDVPPGSMAWEKWLMPLRWDFQPEQQKSREVMA